MEIKLANSAFILRRQLVQHSRLHNILLLFLFRVANSIKVFNLQCLRIINSKYHCLAAHAVFYFVRTPKVCDLPAFHDPMTIQDSTLR